MSVIVTDMSMPTDCYDCERQFGCQKFQTVIEGDGRPSNCPLKSVDDLILEIETSMSWDMFDENGNETDLHKRLMSIIREHVER